MDLGSEHQTLRIYEQVALSALYLLTAIVSSHSSHTGGLHRLAIHYASAGLRFSFHADTKAFAQGGMQPFPGTVAAPSSEVMVDSLPGREVVRQQAPGTATTEQVEDGVKDLTQGMYSGSSGGIGRRDMGLYVGPLFI